MERPNNHLKLTALHNSTRFPGHDCAPQYLVVEPMMGYGHMMLYTYIISKFQGFQRNFGILHPAVYTFVIPGIVAVFLATMTRNPFVCATGWIPAYARITRTG